MNEVSQMLTPLNCNQNYRILVGQTSAVDNLKAEVHLFANQLIRAVYKHIIFLGIFSAL